MHTSKTLNESFLREIDIEIHEIESEVQFLISPNSTIGGIKNNIYRYGIQSIEDFEIYKIKRLEELVKILENKGITKSDASEFSLLTRDPSFSTEQREKLINLANYIKTSALPIAQRGKKMFLRSYGKI
jgi:hypothetical protein